MNRKRTKQTTQFLIGGLSSVALTLVSVIVVYTYTMSSFSYGKDFGLTVSEKKPSKDVEVTFATDTTMADVATLLADKGVIDNAYFFRLEAMLKGTDGDVAPGTYHVNTSMDSVEINGILRTDLLATDTKITIPEGYTLANIASTLEKEEIVTAEAFLQACATGTFTYDFLAAVPAGDNRLEGYLFPDTYMIAKNATPEDVINKMLARFDEIYNKPLRTKTEAQGLTMHEVVTIASMIEKEVSRADELPLASAVIHNRLAANMPLEMPFTVVYVLDKPSNRLTATDLKTKSPYNTFIHKGLPPGPIGNPGQACLEAALAPDASTVLYFAMKDATTGEHWFTDTSKELKQLQEAQALEQLEATTNEETP